MFILMLTSCATMSEHEWKMKQMNKQDKKMMKKVRRAVKYSAK